MSQEILEAVRKARTAATKLNFDWEELLKVATVLKTSLTDDEYKCLLSISLLINSLKSAAIPEEEFNNSFDIWESCNVFSEQEKSVHIAFATLLHIYLEQSISEENLNEYIHRSSPELLEQFKEEFVKISEETIEFAKFYLLLKELKPRGFSAKDLHTAKIIWVSCNSTKIVPTTCTQIALYWLKKKFNPE